MSPDREWASTSCISLVEPLALVNPAAGVSRRPGTLQLNQEPFGLA